MTISHFLIFLWLVFCGVSQSILTVWDWTLVYICHSNCQNPTMVGNLPNCALIFAFLYTIGTRVKMNFLVVCVFTYYDVEEVLKTEKNMFCVLFVLLVYIYFGIYAKRWLWVYLSNIVHLTLLKQVFFFFWTQSETDSP